MLHQNIYSDYNLTLEFYCLHLLSTLYILFWLLHLLNKSSKQSSNYSKTKFHKIFELYGSFRDWSDTAG